MKARIIKFIEGERPNRQYIVVGAARRGSGDATEGGEGEEDMRNRARGQRVSRNRKAITN